MKGVIAVLEIGANYVFHLAAVARAGFESDYASTYEHTVNPADRAILVTHRDRINFAVGSGQGGDLDGLLIFQPGYLNLDSKETYREYFDLLDQGFSTGDYSGFLKRFPNPENWMLEFDELYLSRFAASRDTIRELGGVYIRSLDSYLESVWPIESSKMEPVLFDLNRHFASFDVIGRWEKVTGITFKYDTYLMVLCSALKNGPTANSLGYEKNTFYYGHDLEWMKDFISHEVGTHILIDIMKEVHSLSARSGKKAGSEHEIAGTEPYLLYRAYENLARFYNSIVLEKDELYEIGRNYHCNQFYEAYSKIHSENPSMPPRELFRRGVAYFVEKYPDLK